jgi:hypothetical protein
VVAPRKENFAMKIRTALFLTGFMLIAGGLSAQTRPGDDTAFGPEPANQKFVRALKVPVILDGVEFPAGYVLPDHSLSFVLERVGKDHVVYAFSSDPMAKDFMRQQTAKRAAATRSKLGGVSANSYPDCDWPQESSWFHKSVGCGTSGWLVLSYGDEFQELDSLGWNNSISCVRAACVAEYTTLYSCRYFQMYYSSNCQDPDRLYIAGGDIITDLNNYGFNNRTSSVRFE